MASWHGRSFFEIGVFPEDAAGTFLRRFIRVNRLLPLLIPIALAIAWLFGFAGLLAAFAWFVSFALAFGFAGLVLAGAFLLARLAAFTFLRLALGLLALAGLRWFLRQ